MSVRNPAVAGTFYSANKQQLHDHVMQLVQDNTNLSKPSDLSVLPKAMILPHAGYIYSGACAAQGYSLLSNYADSIHSVLLLGPSHRVAFTGIALPSTDIFMTPLGSVKVDAHAKQVLKNLPFVFESDEAHLQEHSIEVHLPFLQSLLIDFSVIPLVVGDASADEVAQVIEHYIAKPGVLVVVSSDLSHFLNYQQAQAVDKKTSEMICDKNYQLRGEQACGCRPVNGLLKVAEDRDFTVEQLLVCNSGDTAGDKSRVVGYGAYAIY